jgi:hypothetical protein
MPAEALTTKEFHLRYLRAAEAEREMPSLFDILDEPALGMVAE